MNQSKNLFLKLEEYSRKQPNQIALCFSIDDKYERYSYRTLWNDIISNKVNEIGIKLIDGTTNYLNIINYLSCIYRKGFPAFYTPLTPRLDPILYASENQILKERYEGILLEINKNSKNGGFVQFTSGTTGVRKGVAVSIDSLSDHLNQLGSTLSITDNDKIGSWLPLYHDMGLITTLFLPLYYGLTVCYLDPISWSYKPLLFHEMIEREKITLSWQPNFAFSHIVNHQRKIPYRYDLSSIRKIVSCSEPCRYSVFNDYYNEFSPDGLSASALQTSYAMAENIFAVTMSDFKSLEDWSDFSGYISSGKPVADTIIDLVEINKAESVIKISGKSVVNGYINNESDNFSFVNGNKSFFTSDIGDIKNGELYVFGRSDDTIIINGKKILAHEIEEYISQFQDVKKGRVLATNKSESASLVIYYEGALSELDFNQIKKWVTSKFFVSINKFINLEAGFLIKSSSGKIARKKSLEKISLI